VIEIQPHAKKITFKVLEGKMMMSFYHSFQATLEVTEGSAKWTVVFTKKNALCPNPDYYLQRLDSVNKDINTYLLPGN
uniref:hypothetical protein n=1 Tax=Escherichia coli TaxID=562 RepID=UPI00228306E0